MDSLAFLERAARGKPQPVYVVSGDEDFLKRRVLKALRALVFGPEGDTFGLSSYDGDKAVLATVLDELRTLPFLASRRLVIVDAADPFVTRHRESLEQYVATPAEHGTLVLEVKSWPANTRLAKALSDAATLVCKAPAPFKLPEWCARWAKSEYGKELSVNAARLLVDLVGAEMGLLDKEIEKLSIYVGDAARIEADDVDKLVGASRQENIWKVFDAIGSGQMKAALELLERALDQGEEPIALLGAFSLQLRRLARGARLHQQGKPLAAALAEVGIPPFAVKGCEQQIRHLGWRRLDRLYDWLLEVNLGLRGSSQLSPRSQLERLVVRLARPLS